MKKSMYRHNGLSTGVSPKERERLVKLIEECAEVQHAACKILRHGWMSFNPDDRNDETNLSALNRELSDLKASIQEIEET